MPEQCHAADTAGFLYFHDLMEPESRFLHCLRGRTRRVVRLWKVDASLELPPRWHAACVPYRRLLAVTPSYSLILPPAEVEISHR